MTGKSPETLKAAWDALCDQLKAAGEVIAREGEGLDEASQAEGFEHLGHLALEGLAWALVPDADFPRFVHMNDTPEIADNRFAAIRGDAEYLIRGEIGSLFDLNISLHEGWPFHGGRRVWGDLGLKDLAVDDHGRFELSLSAAPRPGNWLQLPADARIVQIREYFNDWDAHRPGVFEIVRLGSEGEAPPRPTAAEVSERFASLGPWLQGYLTTHTKMVRERITTINGVAQPAPAAAGNRNIWYGPGRFRLAPDEAVVLEFAPPRALTWTVQWLTFPWYGSPDLANRTTSLVAPDARVDADGRVRVVICGWDPCAPNWLDIGVRSEGVLMLRWLWCEEAFPVESRVVRRADLDRQLQSRIAPGERLQAQARRRSHWATRAR